MDKRKLEKARQRLEKRLEWFEDDTEKSGKLPKVVVLKHMFTLEELEEDPTLLLDLKQEVWEECEKLGPVTNVVLYDVLFNKLFITQLESDGVMTVRFKDAESALLCIQV